MKRVDSFHRGRALIAGLLILSMTTVAMPAELNSVSAATKQKNKSKVSIVASADGTILTGESRTLTIQKVKKKSIKKLTVTSSKKSVASVKKNGKNKVVIRSKKAGKTTINIKLLLKNKTKYNLKYKANVADTVDRKVEVVVTDGTKSKMTLRFFAKTPLIPYIRVTDYYAEISRGAPLAVKETGEDTYLLTSPGGATATINTKTDVLESDQYDKFKHIFPPEEGEAPINSDYGGAPFLEPLPDEVLQPGKHFTISYTDYGIDLLSDKNDIWFPIIAASDTFTTGYGASMTYSGTKLYHYTDCFEVDSILDTDFFNEYVRQYPNGERPAYAVDYAYDELMLLLDVQYGNPGRCYFSDAIREKGMDRALSETDDQTRAVRDLLKSTSLTDYFMGLGILQDMLFDGGHTELDRYVYRPYGLVKGIEENRKAAYIKELQATAEKIGYTIKHISDTYWDEHDAVADQKGWEDFDYHEQGDTAIYTMGNMNVDPDAWKAYYEEQGDIPNDSYGMFIQCLKKASENKAIKNFVIDLTTNTGGDTNVVSGMLQILVGDPCTYIEFTDTNKRIRCPYNVDTNLDGKFDEKDKEVKYPFNYAVLTTHLAYSCGNMLPSVAKTHGIMVLGETSGGGACALISSPMGCGLPCLYSGSFRFSTKDWNIIDTGAKPDKELEIKTNADGTKDYSAFFDIPSLSKYINEFYKTA